jgi:hypothetical protein
MTKLNPLVAAAHKRVYQKLLDELDTAVVKTIMSDPHSEEALLLNARVEAELQKENAVVVFES